MATKSPTWRWRTTIPTRSRCCSATATATFAPRTDFATGSFAVFVAIGDLNRDGKPDLAVVNSSSNTVSVLLGNGDGELRAANRLHDGSRSPVRGDRAI